MFLLAPSSVLADFEIEGSFHHCEAFVFLFVHTSITHGLISHIYIQPALCLEEASVRPTLPSSQNRQVYLAQLGELFLSHLLHLGHRISE
jgi:hypothetical protein